MEDNAVGKKIKDFEKDLKELKQKYGLDPVATLEFPQYRVLPIEVLLALKVIEKHQYKIMLSYKEIDNANQSRDGNGITTPTSSGQ